MKIDALIETIDGYVRPIADELKYEIYHIEYVKENGEYYLRIYIDKEGGIAFSDCEALSRRVSEIMDTKDPIEEAYFLEVSSPGIYRTLFTEEHYKRFVGSKVLVKFTKSIEGKKNIKGILQEVSDDYIVIQGDETVTVPKDKIKVTNIEGEI